MKIVLSYLQKIVKMVVKFFIIKIGEVKDVTKRRRRSTFAFGKARF